ncbi:MAG: glycosyltransferase [Bacteroidia bacterium]|nr:glycosyltransferase [Bacteroidia bacterium]
MISVSVIMAVYNGEDYLATAIESILNQSFRDFEFIIANDGSSDNSLNILEHYAKIDNRIVVINNKLNIGLPASLNHLITIAKGMLIARMDHDDIAKNNRLAREVEEFESDPLVDFVFSGTTLIDHNSETICESWRPPLKKVLDYLPYCNFIPHPTVMIKKELFIKNGFYRTDIYPKDDMELWNRFKKTGAKFSYIRQSLLYYRINPKSSQQIGDGYANEIYYLYIAQVALGNNAGIKILKKYLVKLDYKNSLMLILKNLVPFSLFTRYYLYKLKKNLKDL